jgi:hypothetical protein
MNLSLRNVRSGLMRHWLAGFQSPEATAAPRRRIAAPRHVNAMPLLWADCPAMLGITAAEREYDFVSSDAGAFDIHEAWGVHE